MPLHVTTHLNFRGEARAALGFYQSVFGGELVLMTYEDMHAVQDPSDAPHVMWGQVAAENGFRIMAYDVQAAKDHDPGQNPFYVALRGDAPDEISSLWEGLADGATILTPLAPAPWAPLYGMLTDRFGVTWIIDVTPDHAA